MAENLVNGIRVGDLNSFGSGDLNFDGVTDIFDLVEMQAALIGSGFAAITPAELAGGATVPEPASAIGLVVAAAAAAFCRRRIASTRSAE